ncbi:glycine-rich RNA-binding protein 2, mitochondrial-like [Oryza brachyantha]|uniref:RRM domain-containing protein n=1 Tax=Oryza brachyantha TaxID=4533 RepID=J3L8D2_ORYBR|nr:glycine-rich RNA-binding protein 2, mitochondrial-like [Oryza brachyantha]XP_040379507.1 glycine-rich RNA-binding protein 2, mitochondrial-like [Oryza brachyantha]XP_040379509.1 glycine-rich RNA-binding protein 2, mitochondrial-like [Oryza brachyantha]
MLNWRRNAVIPLVRLLHPSGARASSSSSSSSCCSKLFVAGLSYDTNETALKDAFSHHGHIIQVKVICHPVTGKSKGYGFVKFASEDEAAAALHKMSGEVIDGRTIRVHYANNG